MLTCFSIHSSKYTRNTTKKILDANHKEAKVQETVNDFKYLNTEGKSSISKLLRK